MSNTGETKTSLQLLAAYRQERTLYVKVVAVAIAVVVVFSLIMPQTFSSTATIMPPESESKGGGLAALLQSAPIAVGLDGAGSNKTALVFKEILTSRTLLEGVVDTLRLTEHPLFEGMDRRDIVEQLEKQITIDPRKTGAIAISADATTGWFVLFSDEPELASATCADIANACRMSLDKINREKSVSNARQTCRYQGTDRHTADSDAGVSV